MHLRNRFIFSFIVFAVIPIFFLGGVALYVIDLSHRRDVSSLELQLIAQKEEAINKFFADTMGMLELRLGSNEEQQEKIADESSSNKELDTLLENIMDTNPAFEEISLISKGQFREILKKSRSQNNMELWRVDRLPQYDLVKEGGQNYISDVYHTLSGPMVTMSAPVYNFDGAVVGVFAAEVNLGFIVKSIETARLGTSGYLILLDSKGLLIAAGGQSEHTPGADLSGFDRVKRIVSGEPADGLQARDRYRSLLDGTSVVGAAITTSKTGWILMAEWPLNDADALMQEIRNQIVVMAVVSILAVLLFAPVFASRLTKPIRQLEKSASEIESGNFEYKVSIKTKDELEELGQAFNSMTAGLKRLQELRNEFVFIAAHELRTPVTAIKGYLSMIVEDKNIKLPDLTLKFINTIWQANERLVQLVNDILEIARSEAGRLKVEVQPIDLKASVRAILEEIKPLSDERKISLNHEEKELPVVMGDEARVKEVMMNFVSNAIKYNRDGGWVKISYDVLPEFVAISIADNGFGLSEEDQKHLFEKFFRSEAEEFKKVQGTGLGLFITKELVERMGGRVACRSAKGKGTAFTFTLPRKLS